MEEVTTGNRQYIINGERYQSVSQKVRLCYGRNKIFTKPGNIYLGEIMCFEKTLLEKQSPFWAQYEKPEDCQSTHFIALQV